MSTRNPLSIVRSLQLANAMLVNTCSSNHEANQDVNCDQKRLSKSDSLLCEQALRLVLLMSILPNFSKMEASDKSIQSELLMILDCA